MKIQHYRQDKKTKDMKVSPNGDWVRVKDVNHITTLVALLASMRSDIEGSIIQLRKQFTEGRLSRRKYREQLQIQKNKLAVFTELRRRASEVPNHD